MPLAFSTLGCPDADIAEVIELARTAAASGVELRAGDGQVIHVGMSLSDRSFVRGELADAGIRVLAVASYVRVCEPGADEECISALRGHISLAADIGASALRVFAGKGGAGPEGDRRAVRRLAAVADDARAVGCRVLIETHDSHPAGRDVAPILAELDEVSPRHPFGIIWDVMHPWRVGETPADTFAAVGPWLDYVQFKDGLPDGSISRIGAGAIPLSSIASCVPRGLWWSFEWEKAWFAELAPLADVLPEAADWYKSAVIEPEL